MRVPRFVLFCTLIASVARAQASPDAATTVRRHVHGATLVSDTLPAADITVGGGFRYVGAQVANLYGNALAEQHIFVRGPSTGAVEAFCWLQFEHFLPTKTYTYDYKPVRTVDLGGLPFIYDVKGWADYRVTTTDTGSDGAALAALLAQHHLSFPTRAVRVRMFYLPTADRRTELMIIYGEAVPEQSTTPTSGADGAPLDSAYPDIARMYVEHVRNVLTIRRHATR